ILIGANHNAFAIILHISKAGKDHFLMVEGESMHLHFLGICGTFMGSLALLAREMGHEVSGCDLNVYPPMSTQLEEQGIRIHQGYDAAQFAIRPDLVIIGNALSRGNEAVEYVLNKKLPYC